LGGRHPSILVPGTSRYEDEVDIHLKPKIDPDWQLRGQQKRVVTPGQNEKYYLAHAQHRGTGKVSHFGRKSKY
jgi:hypothetical protein